MNVNEHLAGYITAQINTKLVNIKQYIALDKQTNFVHDFENGNELGIISQIIAKLIKP